MIEIKKLKIKDYLIEDIEIIKGEKIGVFAREAEVRDKFLLSLAGINRNYDNCFFKKENLYDNKAYFQNRIYLDCQEKYLETLNFSKIADIINTKFKMKIDRAYLAKYIDALKIRGECEITSTYKYIFTYIGNTLINLGLAFSTGKNLIINNPTIHIDEEHKSDEEYIYNELKNYTKLIVLGINNLIQLKDLLNRVILFTDFNEVIVFNPKKDNLYIIDNCNIANELYVFKCKDERLIIKEPPQETLKRLRRQKLNLKRISIYEIEKYL